MTYFTIGLWFKGASIPKSIVDVTIFISYYWIVSEAFEQFHPLVAGYLIAIETGRP